MGHRYENIRFALDEMIILPQRYIYDSLLTCYALHMINYDIVT